MNPLVIELSKNGEDNELRKEFQDLSTDDSLLNNIAVIRKDLTDFLLRKSSHVVDSDMIDTKRYQYAASATRQMFGRQYL